MIKHGNENDPGAGQFANVPQDHGLLRRLVRRRQLRHVRPRLPSALLFSLAQRAHRRDGRRAGRDHAWRSWRASRPSERARPSTTEAIAAQERTGSWPTSSARRARFPHPQPSARRRRDRPAPHARRAGLRARDRARKPNRRAPRPMQFGVARPSNLEDPMATQPRTPRTDADASARFIASEINPFVDEWESRRDLPGARPIPEDGRPRLPRRHQARGRIGGLGLDYSYALATAEAVGIRAAGRGDGHRRAVEHGDAGAGGASVRTSSSASSWRPRSPARWWPPSACRSRVPARTWPRSRPGPGKRRRRLRDQRLARCGSPTAPRPTGCCLLCNTSEGGSAHKQQVADHRAAHAGRKRTRGIEVQKIRKFGMWTFRHGADLLRRGARAGAPSHRRRGHGLHLPDEAVPGRAARRRGAAPVGHGLDPGDHRLHCASARPSAGRFWTTSSSSTSWPSSRPSSKPCAPWSTSRPRPTSRAAT